MITAYYSHDSSLAHDMGAGHPECPMRVRAVTRGLTDAGLDGKLTSPVFEPASPHWLKGIHHSEYIDAIQAFAPRYGLRQLDADTSLGPATMTAALYAAGAAIDAVDRVVGGEAANAFCAMRPPGHHAERDRAMGFCFFNNVAAGAWQALVEHDLERVAIVDFDVHHGNGTEDIFRNDDRVLYCSSYQDQLFPFTDNTSIPGHLIKSPLPAGTGSDAFRRAIESDWLPALDAFNPQLILVSAGFDADHADPLADLMLDTEDFAWVTERICEVADSCCDGQVVSVLEGGYDLSALAAGAAAHVGTLVRYGM